MKNQKEAERAEQQRIKNLVLNYDLQGSGWVFSEMFLSLVQCPMSNRSGDMSVLQCLPKKGNADSDHDYSTDQSGTDNDLYFDPFLQPNPNLSNAITHRSTFQGLGGERHQHNASLQQPSANNASARPADKAGSSRNGQRARKLQLSDVDWYARRTRSDCRS